ncbi:hypothetical protein NP493_2735g00006 [Ridgeia piscesae]|nr:hypothetical protein NP493_2735g00006 [Ridgeia piscesae]
MASLQK